jgi:formate/nitrite transporter FocA (FNT family)
MSPETPGESPPQPVLSAREEEEIEERSPPRPALVHAAVVKQGDDEMERPAGSLFWSGIAAGIAIMVSVSAEAALHDKLAGVPGREALSGLGYTLGFLIVILGRMQLFTEQTMAPVLPLAADPSRRNFTRLMRLWGIVLLGNLLGTAAISAAAYWLNLQSDAMLASMLDVSSRLLTKTPSEMLGQAIPAGFLIASVAWIRSAENENGFWIVIALTWTIALGGFTHVIAGAAEAFLLLWAGKVGIGWVVTGFLLPALVGNIIGGTGLFAMLAHAQVKEEI